MSLYCYSFSTKICKYFRPLKGLYALSDIPDLYAGSYNSTGFWRGMRANPTRRDVAEGVVSTRRIRSNDPTLGIWPMDRPFVLVPLEDSLVLGEKQPKLL